MDPIRQRAFRSVELLYPRTYMVILKDVDDTIRALFQVLGELDQAQQTVLLAKIRAEVTKARSDAGQ